MKGRSRLGAVVAVGVLAVALSSVAAGCGGSSISAFSVNGDETSQTSINDELRVLAANPQFTNAAFNTNSTPSTVKLDSGISAGWLNTVIETDVVRQELERKKVDVSKQDRSDIRQRLGSIPGFSTLPGWFRSNLVDRQAGYVALARERGLDLANDSDNTALGTIVSRLRTRAKVTVDPRYGTWSPRGGAVVAPRAPGERRTQTTSPSG